MLSGTNDNYVDKIRPLSLHVVLNFLNLASTFSTVTGRY